MAMFHVNPKTGDVGKCAATQGKCPFGSLDDHFTSSAAARAAYEVSQEAKLIPKLPPLTLTKADARKLSFDGRFMNAPEQDYTITNEIKEFYEVLGRSSYAAADKPYTAELIKEFMAKLYKLRHTPGNSGLFARSAYMEVAEDLAKFGVITEAPDKGDELIEAEFPNGLRALNSDPADLQNSLTVNHNLLKIYAKPFPEWTDGELEDTLDYLAESNKYFKYRSYDQDFRQAFYVRRNDLIEVGKREKVLAVWESLPTEAKELYTEDELQAQIEALKSKQPFPPYYYSSAKYNGGGVSVEDTVSQSIELSNKKIAKLSKAMIEYKRYEELLNKLDKLAP